MNSIDARLLEEKRVHNIVDIMENDSEYIGPKVGDYYFCHSTLKKIIVFIEDSKSGYEFTKNFFKTCYPYANIELVKLGGYGNIKYIPNYKYYTDYDYDYTIIIYDRGRSLNNMDMSENNRKDIPRVIKRLKKRNPQNKIFIFSPLCFESIPLSFKYLLSEMLTNYKINNTFNTQIHHELVDLINGNISRISWESYIKYGKSIENIIENAIEEITNKTMYEITHSPSKVSDCWIKNCCKTCNNIDFNKCNIIALDKYNLVHKEKLELIAEYSALGGLTYIMDKIFGIQYRRYPLIISNTSIYSNNLVVEV